MNGIYPDDSILALYQIDSDTLADLALPDGCSDYERDWTMIIHQCQDLEGSEEKDILSRLNSAKQVLYGVCLFKRKKDDQLMRGARQMSLVILLQLPIFDILIPIMDHVSDLIFNVFLITMFLLLEFGRERTYFERFIQNF